MHVALLPTQAPDTMPHLLQQVTPIKAHLCGWSGKPAVAWLSGSLSSSSIRKGSRLRRRGVPTCFVGLCLCCVEHTCAGAHMQRDWEQGRVRRKVLTKGAEAGKGVGETATKTGRPPRLLPSRDTGTLTVRRICTPAPSLRDMPGTACVWVNRQHQGEGETAGSRQRDERAARQQWRRGVSNASAARSMSACMMRLDEQHV